MSDYIERDKAIEAIAEHLMGEAMCDYPDANDNIEDWKEIGEAILENIPPAEVIPKGSDEASLAYAEGWKNGEEAERSRRPKGEWIYVVQGWHTLRRCSVCKWAQTNSDSKYMGYKYNFCPNCGADMRGE